MSLAQKGRDRTSEDHSASALYDRDFHAWAMEQAALIRRLAPEGLDVENVAEELETLGRSERREICNRTGILLVHLLKARYQPEQRKGGWDATIRIQRLELKKLVAENPSLRSAPISALVSEYETARLKTHAETGLHLDLFPQECPFTADQVLDDTFFG